VPLYLLQTSGVSGNVCRKNQPAKASHVWGGLFKYILYAAFYEKTGNFSPPTMISNSLKYLAQV